MKAEGITIDAITPQNEPLHGGNNPSMVMQAAEQANFIKNSLGPAFVNNNINTKITGNELLWKILEHPSYIAAVAATKPGHLMDEELLKKIYQSLTISEEYTDYITAGERVKKTEKDILAFIFTDLMLPNENFISHIEEHFINWDDDGGMMNILMLNFLQKPHSCDFTEFVSKEKV